MGCTDILGISEIRTGAKLIDIGVGPDPFKWPGKGGWEEGTARLSSKEGAAEGLAALELCWVAVC